MEVFRVIPGAIRRLSACILIQLSCGLVLVLSQPTQAQEELPDAAPPPIRSITKEDQARLKTKKDVKDRTRLTLELMDVRMTSAERLYSERNFDAMFRELGNFHALLDDGLGFLQGQPKQDSNKVLDNFKRLEIGLRRFLPRIEVIRREIPLRYDDYLKKLGGYVRDARTKATEPLFGDSVVPDRKPPANPEL
jgi:hypothetical protein